MTIVVDASCVVAALVDDGAAGRWAETQLTADDLAAPHLMPVEVANVLRRAVLTGDLAPDIASLAHGDLLALPVELFEYEPLADRVWELRSSVTTYDGWYVALAEVLEARLATVDLRLARSKGPLCTFLTPTD